MVNIQLGLYFLLIYEDDWKKSVIIGCYWEIIEYIKSLQKSAPVEIRIAMSNPYIRKYKKSVLAYLADFEKLQSENFQYIPKKCLKMGIYETVWPIFGLIRSFVGLLMIQKY